MSSRERTATSRESPSRSPSSPTRSRNPVAQPGRATRPSALHVKFPSPLASVENFQQSAQAYHTYRNLVLEEHTSQNYRNAKLAGMSNQQTNNRIRVVLTESYLEPATHSTFLSKSPDKVAPSVNPQISHGREQTRLREQKNRPWGVRQQGRFCWLLGDMYNHPLFANEPQRDSWLNVAKNIAAFISSHCFDPADGRM